MKPFKLDQEWIYPGVNHWTREILGNLGFVNDIFPMEKGTILDVGGGKAPISTLVNTKHYNYVLVDPNYKSLEMAPNFIDKKFGYAEDLPIDSNSIDMMITSSCLQYMDQALFFKEATRVLKPGGILAIHENGPMNPIILIARLIQRGVGIFNRKHWLYRNSIKRYYRPVDVLGLELVRLERKELITPVFSFFQVAGFPFSEKIYDKIKVIDNLLLKIPFINRMSFLTVAVYVKL